ncbi:carbohydrate ABC transporter substrate-binding protein [Aerococcaceae bacterium zg-BR22]|uniref:ABC transporter substrate-binding protein n=1 Tax=Aerococcaceae bacterium zg-1292 TaxID=2774330 RepID=UPI004063C596|nr:carbohydrate ABC transporter substrate-binding protein [Aerococcaceae bacterium zg-BR22]
MKKCLKKIGKMVAALSMCVSLSTSVTANAKDTVRFSWWGNDDRHQLTLSAIEKFKELNPDIDVKAEYSGFGSLLENFTTQFAGGTEADLITVLYNWIGQFSPEGDGFYNLEELKDIIDLSQYDEEALKFGYSNGVLQGIPHGQNVLVIALNKTVFDKAGVEIPKTWDEYKEAASKLPKGSFALVAPTPKFAVTLYLQQKTGLTEFDEKGKLNYTEEDYKEAMAWYKDLVDSGVFVSRQSYLDNVGTEPVSVAQNAKFISGEYAGVLEWNGGLASNAATLEETGQELVIAPLPVIENAKFEGTMSKPTMLFSISKNTKSPEAAAKLLNFILNDPEGVKLMGVSRGIPLSKIAAETLEREGMISGVVKEGYEYGLEVPKLQQTSFYEDGTLLNIFQTQMEAYELGQLTLEEAAHEVFEQTKAQAEVLAKN